MPKRPAPSTSLPSIITLPPKLPSKSKSSAKDESKAGTQKFDARGVVYVGHIPHGFYEDQLRGYLAQFGEIKHLYLSRSRKSGKSRGYAFVQFVDALVARIAAQSLNGYPLGGKVLRSELVDPHKVNPDTFKHADRKWTTIPWRNVVRELQGKQKPSLTIEKRLKRKFTREEAANLKLKEAGIDFEGPTFKSIAVERGILLGDGSDQESEEEEEEEEVNMKISPVVPQPPPSKKLQASVSSKLQKGHIHSNGELCTAVHPPAPASMEKEVAPSGGVKKKTPPRTRSRVLASASAAASVALKTELTQPAPVLAETRTVKKRGEASTTPAPSAVKAAPTLSATRAVKKKGEDSFPAPPAPSVVKAVPALPTATGTVKRKRDEATPAPPAPSSAAAPVLKSILKRRA